MDSLKEGLVSWARKEMRNSFWTAAEGAVAEVQGNVKEWVGPLSPGQQGAQCGIVKAGELVPQTKVAPGQVGAREGVGGDGHRKVTFKPGGVENVVRVGEKAGSMLQGAEGAGEDNKLDGGRRPKGVKDGAEGKGQFGPQVGGQVGGGGGV
jgi:hypothetical protein